MSGRTRHITMIFLAMLGLSSYAWASATGAVVISGAEQSTAGIWDIGTVTVTVNSYAVTVYYGQYSTVDSIASEIAAKFSSDCNGPANARSAAGGSILFQTRGSSALTQLNVTTSSNLSFTGSANTSIMPTTTTATIGSTVVAPGQSTVVDVQVSCGSACGLVDYRIDGGEWGAVALDGNGHFSAATGTNWAAGLHNVVVKFQGNGTFMPSTSNPVSFTITSSAGGQPTPIYSYSLLKPDGITSWYAPNGNISAYTDSVNGSWSDIGYDGVNRLIAATTTPVGGSIEYQCWTYDSFGNRKSQTISATPCNIPSPPLPTTQAQYDAHNQITSTNLAPQGLGYDASGNVTNDGTNQYLYDAEGRICAVGYAPISGGVAMTQYIYDADGNRVAKGTISTWSCDTASNGFTETGGYVIGPNGEQITEVDGSGGWVHTNVYAAGQLIATYDPQGLHFHLTDWLGTRRVQTDYAGTTEATYKNLPFGEMIPQYQNLGATQQHFTGKERDSESGLDYFGARYYSSAMGRFLSPDWAAKAEPVPYAKLDNPQSLNLYGYVGNNPLMTVDPDGHSSLLDQLKKDLGQISNEDLLSYAGIDAKTDRRAQQQNTNLSPTDKVALKVEQKALGPTRESVAEKNSHEYGGLIVRNNKSGKISATDPIRGNGISIDVDSIPVPAGTTVIATYHSHPHSSAVEDGGASQGDVNNSAAHNNRPGYVLDSFGGRVYRYDGHTDARPFPAGTYIGTVQ